ncbi:MAG: metal ABC transporter ATP-binding protein [Phycisphaerales bacterium]
MTTAPATEATAAAAPPGEPAILCEDVSYTYPGADAPALDRVNLRVMPGERLGILGPNGGGKSTLLRVILGLLTGHRGRVEVCGMPPARARASGLIGYLAQRPTIERVAPLSARQLIEAAVGWRIRPWRSLPHAARQWVARTLDLVGASAWADRPIGKLSGGQLQRVLIARALAGSPRILVLDEPAVGIDAAGQQLLADLLARVHRELSVTIVIVSHDLRAIAAGSDRVACLAQHLHYHDSPRGLTPALLAELFSHDVIGSLGTLGPVHVDAHAAADCTDPSHHHGHAHGSDLRRGGDHA